MKYLIILLMFLTGCKGFTQADVDEAARVQLRNKERCTTVANSLDAISEFKKGNNDWLCLVYKKTYLNNPVIVFYVDDLGPITHYLYIKEKKKLDK